MFHNHLISVYRRVGEMFVSVRPCDWGALYGSSCLGLSQLSQPVQGRSLKSKTQVAMRKGFSKTGGVAEGFAKSCDI